MPTQTIMDNEYATLWYHPEKRIVHHKVHQFLPSKQIRELLEKGADVFEKMHAEKWLSDDRGNGAVPRADVEWADTVWIPRVVKAGWKHWAIVLPEKVVGQMNMKQVAKQYSKYGIIVQMFSDPDAAMRWLEKQ